MYLGNVPSKRLLELAKNLQINSRKETIYVSFSLTHKSEIKAGLCYLQPVGATVFQRVNERLRRGGRKARPGHSCLLVLDNCFGTKLQSGFSHSHGP